MSYRLARATLLSALVLAGSGCEERAPLDPGLARIRPANPVSAPRGQRVSYELSPKSELSFSFSKRKGRPTGVLTGLSGKLLVDLSRLEATRGALLGDLSSLAVVAPESEHTPDDPTAAALAWLGAAPGIPEREQAESRVVRFELHRIERLTADSPIEGRRVKSRPGADGEDGVEEIRRVDFRATGDLTLNARRATMEWNLTARFEYPEPALSGVAPTRIVIETRRPASLVLSVFDILPRNANGTTLWAERAAARKRLGRAARVSARLVLEPAR